MRFDNFDVSTGATPEEQRLLSFTVQQCQQYVQQRDGWLVLSGGYASGKTHLAAAVANGVVTQRLVPPHDVLFLTAADLLDTLRNTFNNNSVGSSAGEIMEQVRTAALLILDDYTTETSGWAHEKLFQILDRRFVRRLPTVITTSSSLNDLHPRLVSRLVDRRVCQVLGLDVRPYGKRVNTAR